MTAPLCRYCGKTIKKKITTVYFSKNVRDRNEEPTSKEEAQKLFNEQIVSIKFIERDGRRVVNWVGLWDGETYLDQHFCKDSCAQFFGRMMAEHNKTVSTTSYFKALETQRQRLK